jgi:chlorite dismutase
MTILAPSVAARPVESPTATTRQYLRYLFYKARPSWRLVRHGERTAARAKLLAALEPFAERLPVRRAYSTVGTRGDADFLVWMVVSERLEHFQELQAAGLATTIGAHLDTPYSYLAMTKRSQYVDRHAHVDGSGEGQRCCSTAAVDCRWVRWARRGLMVDWTFTAVWLRTPAAWPSLARTACWPPPTRWQTSLRVFSARV